MNNVFSYYLFLLYNIINILIKLKRHCQVDYYEIADREIRRRMPER